MPSAKLQFYQGFKLSMQSRMLGNSVAQSHIIRLFQIIWDQRWWLACAQPVRPGGEERGPFCQIAFLPGLEIVQAILNARKCCAAGPLKDTLWLACVQSGWFCHG